MGDVMGLKGAGWIRTLFRRRWARLGGLMAFGLFAGWIAIMQFPGLVFWYSVSERGLTLRSDRPFDEARARWLLTQVRQRLDGAPYGQPAFTADVCIAHSEWRRRILFLPSLKAIGISYPVTRHVFIRSSRIESNRVVNAEGREVGGYFTLGHVIGHELGHVQMYRKAGRMRTLAVIPSWIREGYAEYVGGIPDFEFDSEGRAFLAEDASMRSPRPGAPPYRRLHLLLVFLLEKQGWSMERLTRECPEQQSVEAALRAWLQTQPPVKTIKV